MIQPHSLVLLKIYKAMGLTWPMILMDQTYSSHNHSYELLTIVAYIAIYVVTICLNGLCTFTPTLICAGKQKDKKRKR